MNPYRSALPWLIVLVSLFPATCWGSQPATTSAANYINVDVDATHVLNVFVPGRTIGAGIDAENDGAVAQIFTPTNVAQMLSAGLGPLSYRLYTELSVQDWHWNPRGRWSDHGQGYWTGDVSGAPSIRDSYGYRLPHRGFTHDQGNDDDYSRLDDGDASTYWKSNPYLSQRYTGEPDALHPQWALVDLGSSRSVDAMQIRWGSPFAREYAIQYWNGPDAIGLPAQGRWVTFPNGVVNFGEGGSAVIRLSGAAVSIQFVRVVMTSSSSTCDSHGKGDPRNCAGYAIAELRIGTVSPNGRFNDAMRHSADLHQTTTYVSSVDPWHAPANRVQDEEQPGLDTVFRSELSRNLPVMVPVSLLYGTPEDAVAELRYLKIRHYPIARIELGEEPDGQYIAPEDYAALFLLWARRIHSFDPSLQLGGPVFQGGTQDVQTWPNARGDVSWLHRLLEYLRARGELGALNFMSFEHYPFDACDSNPLQDLRMEPDLVKGIVDTWRADGLPVNVPLLITEANFSANAGAPFQDIVGGLWFGDFAGSFLSAGGKGIYLYQYAPEPLQQTVTNCVSWGSYGMFAGWNTYAVRQRTSQYFAAELLMRRWAQVLDAPHALLAATMGPTRQSAVTSYVLRRPDGTYALLFVNKDQSSVYQVRIAFHTASGIVSFANPITQSIFGKAQYAWHPNGPNGFANPDGPAVTVTLPAKAKYSLAPESLTVISGALAKKLQK
ncbi:MAG: discoidin domain-containing protein [Candidatus Eremiobacteraeota bacterium]|nr:discoidin domain-containing protein [Candidatus Eremiobacteraeota bacterium]